MATLTLYRRSDQISNTAQHAQVIGGYAEDHSAIFVETAGWTLLLYLQPDEAKHLAGRILPPHP